MQVFDVTGSILRTYGKLEQLYYKSILKNRGSLMFLFWQQPVLDFPQMIERMPGNTADKIASTPA